MWKINSIVLCLTVALISAFSLTAFVAAAPVPKGESAQRLVAKLSDDSVQLRDQAFTELRKRTDANPWLRQASKSRDADTAKRALALLSLSQKTQQRVEELLTTAIRDNHCDLFMEAFHLWQPAKKDDLWRVGPEFGKTALTMFEKRTPERPTELEVGISSLHFPNQKYHYHDGSMPERFGDGFWFVRTDRLVSDVNETVGFGCTTGRANCFWFRLGYLYTQAEILTKEIRCAVVICNGIDPRNLGFIQGRTEITTSVVICRGNANLVNGRVAGAILLVDGDIDLRGASELNESVIRASGRVILSPNAKPVNCKVEEHAKNPTAPYQFFELADIGLSVADDEEGLVVTGVKPDTCFATAGLAKRDIILAVDDNEVTRTEELRKRIRKAFVEYGDCLITFERDGKIHTQAVYFSATK